VANGGADPYLERIAARNGNDLHRYFESGQLSATTLRNLARVPNRTPSPLNHVSVPGPEAPHTVVPSTPTLTVEGGARPIVTNLQGGNAWPGVSRSFLFFSD
jgi:hypothetical protein